MYSGQSSKPVFKSCRILDTHAHISNAMGLLGFMRTQIHRRRFLQETTLWGAARWLGGTGASHGGAGPNDRLNIGIIGVAHQGNYDLSTVTMQNIVALCDVDDSYLSAAAPKFPGAKTYNDFRRLLDQNGIDAVVVATPDHTHAVATVAALRSGRHVYCEKPLTRTILSVAS